jgi:hypothetical protein
VLPFASKTYLSAERSASTEVTSVFVPQPFAPDDLVTLTERGRVLILDSRGAIVRVYSETGDLQDTLVVIRPPEVEIVEEDIAPVIERFGSFFSESSIRAEAHYPLFDGVHACRGSSLALGSLGGPGATSQTALLLSDVPSVLGVLQFPPGSRIVGFAPPLVVVARGGSLGLTRLVTYCITDDIWAAYVYDRSRASELVCPSRGD